MGQFAGAPERADPKRIDDFRLLIVELRDRANQTHFREKSSRIFTRPSSGFVCSDVRARELGDLAFVVSISWLRSAFVVVVSATVVVVVIEQCGKREQREGISNTITTTTTVALSRH